MRVKPENVSLCLCMSLCVRRNRAEPSQQNKLSAVEGREEHGKLFFFLLCPVRRDVFFFFLDCGPCLVKGINKWQWLRKRQCVCVREIERGGGKVSLSALQLTAAPQ